MSFTITTEVKNNRIKTYTKQSQRVVLAALNDCLDDLIRTSSQSAPKDIGTLERSHSKNVEYKGTSPVGVVTYSVKKKGGKGAKKGNFNYALKMHEGNYSLGEKSRQKPGGTGMSGKTYPVGKGFLGNVLKGEIETYRKHIDKAIKSL